jgi:hypothetical protein
VGPTDLSVRCRIAIGPCSSVDCRGLEAEKEEWKNRATMEKLWPAVAFCNLVVVERPLTVAGILPATDEQQLVDQRRGSPSRAPFFWSCSCCCLRATSSTRKEISSSSVRLEAGNMRKLVPCGQKESFLSLSLSLTHSITEQPATFCRSNNLM